jgi:hypothetical protein
VGFLLGHCPHVARFRCAGGSALSRPRTTLPKLVSNATDPAHREAREPGEHEAGRGRTSDVACASAPALPQPGGPGGMAGVSVHGATARQSWQGALEGQGEFTAGKVSNNPRTIVAQMERNIIWELGII